MKNVKLIFNKNWLHPLTDEASWRDTLKLRYNHNKISFSHAVLRIYSNGSIHLSYIFVYEDLCNNRTSSVKYEVDTEVLLSSSLPKNEDAIEKIIRCNIEKTFQTTTLNINEMLAHTYVHPEIFQHHANLDEKHFKAGSGLFIEPAILMDYQLATLTKLMKAKQKYTKQVIIRDSSNAHNHCRGILFMDPDRINPYILTPGNLFEYIIRAEEHCEAYNPTTHVQISIGVQLDAMLTKTNLSLPEFLILSSAIA